MKTRYVIITPVRDEEQYIESTITSVAAQNFFPRSGSSWTMAPVIAPPRLWSATLNSTAGSGFCGARPRFRKSGAGVVEAFYDGYDALERKDWNFLVKLDGDLSFPADYFPNLLERFQTQTI